MQFTDSSFLGRTLKTHISFSHTRLAIYRMSNEHTDFDRICPTPNSADTTAISYVCDTWIQPTEFVSYDFGCWCCGMNAMRSICVFGMMQRPIMMCYFVCWPAPLTTVSTPQETIKGTNDTTTTATAAAAAVSHPFIFVTLHRNLQWDNQTAFNKKRSNKQYY